MKFTAIVLEVTCITGCDSRFPVMACLNVVTSEILLRTFITTVKPQHVNSASVRHELIGTSDQLRCADNNITFDTFDFKLIIVKIPLY